MRKEVMSKVWTGSIIAALVVSVGIYTAMLQFEKKILSDYERGSVYVSAAKIPKGQVLTEDNFKKYLVQKEVDRGCIPGTALQSEDQIVGLAAVCNIEEGVFLTTGMFETENKITAQMKQPVIAGFKADDLYQVAGGVLRAGDRIHIYTVSDIGEAKLVWEDIYVEKVFDGSGKTIEPGDASAAAQRLNVYIDAENVERFYSELARGTLRAVKVCK